MRATSAVPDVPGIGTSTTDDADEELDVLLGLQKPITELSLASSKSADTADEMRSDSEKGEQ